MYIPNCETYGVSMLHACVFVMTYWNGYADLVVSPSASVSCAPSDLTAIRNWYILIDASMATLRPAVQQMQVPSEHL